MDMDATLFAELNNYLAEENVVSSAISWEAVLTRHMHLFDDLEQITNALPFVEFRIEQKNTPILLISLKKK